MTVLANALLSIPQGQNVRAAQIIPGGLKRIGIAQILKVTMDATTFPAGVVTLTIGISTDNQASFREASMTCSGLPGRGTHWIMSYSLDKDAAPTNVRLATDSPSAFQTQTLLEAL